MQAIRIPLKKFDLDGFIRETLRFLDGKANYPTLAITWVEAPGRYPNDETDEKWDFRSKLLNEGVYLFFPFAISDMEGAFDCANSHSYMHPGDAFQKLNESEEEPEYEDEDEIDEDPFGDAIVGYLIQVKDGTISVASAICAICGCYPPPTIDLLPDAHFLEQSMTDFIEPFLKSGSDVLEKTSCDSFNLEDFRARVKKSESSNRRQSIIKESEAAKHKQLPGLSAILEELISQIMNERHLSRNDAEVACCLALRNQGHFQRLKEAVLWELDQEEMWGKTEVSYCAPEMDILVKASGMNPESILAEIFKMVDAFLFYLNQTKMKFMDNPALSEFARREVALVKSLKLDVTKHFDPLARVAGAFLSGYARAQESLPGNSHQSRVKQGQLAGV